MAASLGSTESLIVPPSLQQPKDLTGDLRLVAGVTETTTRLSIGLEDIEDLLADLEQALRSRPRPIRRLNSHDRREVVCHGMFTALSFFGRHAGSISPPSKEKGVISGDCWHVGTTRRLV
jgi:hypothetical protein